MYYYIPKEVFSSSHLQCHLYVMVCFTCKKKKYVAPLSSEESSPANTGDTGSIPDSGRSPAEGNGYPLQYSCLGNPMNRGA